MCGFRGGTAPLSYLIAPIPRLRLSECVHNCLVARVTAPVMLGPSGACIQYVKLLLQVRIEAPVFVCLDCRDGLLFV